MRTYNFEPPRYTYNDYKNWKEDWELVNGYPVQLLPSAIWRHSQTLSRCNFQVLKSLDENQECSCNVFIELDWKVNDFTILRPDLMIVCNKIKLEYLDFPPNLIIELLSPNNQKISRNIKFELYRENGVKYYLMIDVLKEVIEIYKLIDNYYKQVNISTFELNNDCAISFNFDKIWK